MAPKTVVEIEFKFYLCFLDAILDQNYFIHSLDVEDNSIPEIISLERNNLSETFRLKPLPRSGNVIEKIFIKMS